MMARSFAPSVTYPRPPDPPAPDQDETAAQYGCRLLVFYLREGIYVTSSPEQLRLADHAAHIAVSAPGILPIAVDRISAVRHEILGAIRRRDLILAEDVTVGAHDQDGATAASCRPDDRDTGPSDPSGRVPRRPYPIGPSQGDTIDRRMPVRPAAVPEIAF